MFESQKTRDDNLRKGKILAIVVVVFIGYLVISNLIWEQELIKNKRFTVCRVTRYDYVIRRSELLLYYDYKANGIKYSGRYSTYRLKWDSLGVVIGHKFPMVYSAKNPFHSQMLLFPEDFNKMTCDFPDYMKPYLRLRK